MKNLSSLIENLEDSAVSQIITRAAEAGWKDTLHLAGGEPKFDIPSNATTFLNDHDFNKVTKYSPFKGYPDLIELLLTKLKKINSIIK